MPLITSREWFLRLPHEQAIITDRLNTIDYLRHQDRHDFVVELRCEFLLILLFTNRSSLRVVPNTKTILTRLKDYKESINDWKNLYQA